MKSVIPRIGVCGLALETNRFAPPVTSADLETAFVAADDALLAVLRSDSMDGFACEMERLGPSQITPLWYAALESGGPLEHPVYRQALAEMLERMKAAQPLDGVYVIGHGAGATTSIDDMDGDYVAAIREVVGPDVPIVMLTDMHANPSDALVRVADALIGYRTNPHMDIVARGRDAARLMRRLLSGERLSKSFIRVPLITAQVAQRTAPGEPFGDIMGEVDSLADDDTYPSVWSGFPLADVPYAGTAVLVLAEDRCRGEAGAIRLADKIWASRTRFAARLLSVAEATTLALRSHDPYCPIILADVSDNPGGGGRSNTTWLIESLHSAGARSVIVGLFFDPPLVQAAFEIGVGGTFEAHFNSAETSIFSQPYVSTATVKTLRDGVFAGKLGMARDVAINLGRTCVLDLGGIQVVVNERRQQIYAADYFEYAGLDPHAADVIVVKSRGHFRAGFEAVAPPQRIFEVAAPGIASPDLAALEWKRIDRPIFPLDPDMSWSASEALTAI